MNITVAETLDALPLFPFGYLQLSGAAVLRETRLSAANDAERLPG